MILLLLSGTAIPLLVLFDARAELSACRDEFEWAGFSFPHALQYSWDHMAESELMRNIKENVPGSGNSIMTNHGPYEQMTQEPWWILQERRARALAAKHEQAAQQFQRDLRGAAERYKQEMQRLQQKLRWDAEKREQAAQQIQRDFRMAAEIRKQDAQRIQQEAKLAIAKTRDINQILSKICTDSETKLQLQNSYAHQKGAHVFISNQNRYSNNNQGVMYDDRLDLITDGVFKHLQCRYDDGKRSREPANMFSGFTIDLTRENPVCVYMNEIKCDNGLNYKDSYITILNG
ncbi:hypothetical protein QAD02_018139 [Eretmocerus hayati]|uniref:Uncharacterized protein n=1 Tax=Eretmocerus hayati TaxID=131215 RepID=A0ACC2PIX4_9HYME|nr:hypothetical protein QAD02_018139 [Eretmocerus hayati]